MLRILEVILSWLFPVYWEITIVNKSGNETHSDFFCKESAESWMDQVMAGDTNDISYVYMDKYINIRPDFLIKVHHFHKGWSSKFKEN
jgi:hypothetical protein